MKIQSGVLGFSLAEHIEGVTQGCERVISGANVFWYISVLLGPKFF